MKRKIPKSVKFTPRCPLCHAVFVRKVIPSRQANLARVLDLARSHYKAAVDRKDEQEAKDAQAWGEQVEASIRAGAAEAFFCHFCKVAISCNDPFVGRWEETYAQGEKVMCPACDHEMRMFCTSTGYAQFKCPVKKCQAKWESMEPDRKAAPTDTLLDAQGDPIALPNVDRAIATPGQPSIGQMGAAPDDPDLPAVVNVEMPPKDATA